MKKIKNLKLKIALTAVSFVAVYYLQHIYSPIIGVNVALNQAEDTFTSSAGIQTMDKFRNMSYLLYPLLPVLIFYKDIFGKRKGDNN